MAFSNLSGQPLLSQTVMSPCVFPFKFISSYSYSFISIPSFSFPPNLISVKTLWPKIMEKKFVHLGINYVRNYNVDVLRCKRTKSYPAVFSFIAIVKFHHQPQRYCHFLLSLLLYYPLFASSMPRSVHVAL